jgi:hypothetical protein
LSLQRSSKSYSSFLTYISSLFFAFFCCSFLLHVTENLICIFLVSCQLVLLSALTKLLRPYCGRKEGIRLFFPKKVISIDISHFYSSFFVRVKISLSYNKKSVFGGLEVPKFAGSHPAEAVGFLGRKNPQHAFLRRESKAVGPMS